VFFLQCIVGYFDVLLVIGLTHPENKVKNAFLIENLQIAEELSVEICYYL